MAELDSNPVLTGVPEPGQKLWRYMALWKFESLLKRTALYFRQAERLSDRFEGSYGHANRRLRKLVYRDSPLPPGTHEKLNAANLLARRWVFVNCWIASDVESDTMWKAYGSGEDSVAISTTVGTLESALPRTQERNTVVRHVQYADFEKLFTPESNVLWPFVYKRREFAAENEVRALYSRLPLAGDSLDFAAQPPDGEFLSVDVLRLIDEIVTRPDAGMGHKENVTALASRFGLEGRVRSSSLDAEPGGLV